MYSSSPAMNRNAYSNIKLLGVLFSLTLNIHHLSGQLLPVLPYTYHKKLYDNIWTWHMKISLHILLIVKIQKIIIRITNNYFWKQEISYFACLWCWVILNFTLLFQHHCSFLKHPYSSVLLSLPIFSLSFTNFPMRIWIQGTCKMFTARGASMILCNHVFLSLCI